ncbi:MULTISPECIES: cobalamin B12-binding domain-containing protein [unclassified Adlercreutzia]|uniref:cobalamin B12-binding domain-containing protein n=1 Tax=unclassified Adlercreutzia TaxID=2636013 RepID=UPI0013ECD977|nr:MULTISPECIES: cobalamin B12-binding domain-containing protein [unclassified Adlercreutzia]
MSDAKKKTILGASIGNCVHVAGVYHFLQLAEKEGYECHFLGPAVPVDRLFEEIERLRPTIVGISYRLTPENVVPLLDEVERRAQDLDYDPIWDFGGTKPVADVARRYGMFSYISDGFDDINDNIRFLRGEGAGGGAESYGRTLLERISKTRPYPVLRHHFGLPSVEETVEGVRAIAEAKVLDVISLGTDQNAQQFLFDQRHMNPELDGAGGVPVRTRDDLARLKEASLTGNFPLMRCYSGTADVFEYAELLADVIDNAWAAIPLSWYNELDGRGTRPIEGSIREAQELIRWHARRGIPVEINEPHHWGLRDAHDVIPVAMAYVSAYNAKKLGVEHYISQYMFNNPSGLSFGMDLAKMLAMREMVESLADDGFHVYRETRAGLPLFNADPCVAKGQLAASTFMQMCLEPHIIHVVGYCEADHAAGPEEVVESCKIVRGVIRHTLGESFSIDKDPAILARKDELVAEAKTLLGFICDKYAYVDDPLASSDVLADAIKEGFVDAVHIVKGGKFKGDLVTALRDGTCVAVDRETGEVLDESRRLARLEEREAREAAAESAAVELGRHVGALA